jgi:two-component system chemotaxis response regulator CheB
MPEMDGLEAFKRIMDDYPVPTIILSAINPQNMDASVQALLMGAFDYIVKPGGIGAKDLPRFREELRSKVLLASQSQIKKIFSKASSKRKITSLRQQRVNETFEFGLYLKDVKPIDEIITEKVEPVKSGVVKTKPEPLKTDIEEVKPLKKAKIKKKAAIDKEKVKAVSRDKKKSSFTIPDLKPVMGARVKTNLIVMGASVGGPRTLRTILKDLPSNLSCPILLVQHLNAFFLESFVKSLNSDCKLQVKMAKNGESLRPGIVYVSPGEKHMELTLKGSEPTLRIFKGEPVNFCIPSIDVLFFSAARIYKEKTLGVLLTGMGRDGVAGLGTIQKLGGKTIAESEETCVLYGMPRNAKEQGVADMILPDYKISNFFLQYT